MKEKLSAFLQKGKWLRSALFTVVLIAIIIAVYDGIIIGLNKANITDIDLTSEKLYSLSQESKDKIKSISQDTKIILYGMSKYPEVETYANLYAKQNEHITYEILEDVNTRSDLKLVYGLGSSTDKLIIIECGEKQKALTTNDLYSYDYSTYENVDITEQSLTNAILAVNLEKTPKIYIATDHEYYKDQYTIATEYLTNEANDVSNLNIITNGGIPADCDTLIIPTLSEDFSEFEKNEILAYINNGGKLMILADPNFGKISLPNFDEVLSVYGVSMSQGEIFETNSSNMISGYADMIIPDVNTESEITRYISTDGAVVFMGAGKISSVSSEELENLNVTKTDLVTAKSSAFLRNTYNTETVDKLDTDEDAGGAVLGTLLTKKITKEDGTEVNSELILYSSSIFASDLAVTLYGTNSNSSSQVLGIMFYNNKDLLVNSVSYLTQRTDNITIRKDQGTVYTFTATQTEKNVIVGIIVALPIIIILTGIIVWQVRRRKK